MEPTTRAKSGGSRKIGRNKRKGTDTAMSAFVRGKTSAEKYFKQHGLTTHHSYIRGRVLAYLYKKQKTTSDGATG